MWHGKRIKDKWQIKLNLFFFCGVLFIFNKYSEFLAFVVICIDSGLWRVHCEQCLW
jgi:hypothetical protein